MPDSKTASDPPFVERYAALLRKSGAIHDQTNVVEECDLPLIDLNNLMSEDEGKRRVCTAGIAMAASEWGFFQVVNHGISQELLREMRREQMKVFEMPFERKISCGLLNGSYRWGAPMANSAKQLSWSEAFHVPLTKIPEESCYGEFLSLREVLEKLAVAMFGLARLLAGVLAENLGHPIEYFDEVCDESTCFLRLNRYPPCTMSREMYGLVPHTDSDFLTIVSQDHVGGLQLMKDSRWVAVKPNHEALIVNIGDLFQAWSNDAYKSAEHRVMSNEEVDRYSIAYFMCPPYDSLLGSSQQPSIYRNFTFGEYREQVQEDVRKTGHKVGLAKFLISSKPLL